MQKLYDIAIRSSRFRQMYCLEPIDRRDSQNYVRYSLSGIFSFFNSFYKELIIAIKDSLYSKKNINKNSKTK